MSEMGWYEAGQTKRGLVCIMDGCKPCTAKVYCREHDKPSKETAPSIPGHCKSCGEFIYDAKKDTKGMFSP